MNLYFNSFISLLKKNILQPLRFANRILLHCDVGLNLMNLLAPFILLVVLSRLVSLLSSSCGLIVAAFRLQPR